ncbi:MAG: T9SS type A sorting domain-containing protein [Candidatus Cloacimonetes bacterium]|nr:T9SS type A sorting domain-containing protein [Candidatus Cloacimonadota bacterium]
MRKCLSLLLVFLAISTALAAQDFYDIDTVNEIRLYFAQDNWRQILKNLYAQGKERLVGNAVINGVPFDSGGVRFKGNSSYSPNRIKNPFNIKLDHIIPGQLLGPYGTLKLANGYFDPSFVRETLSYEIARKYMPACRANYANLYVNDVLIGVYTSVQDVDAYFMNEHFHTAGQPRFKCDTNTMNAVTVWGYLGDDPTSYQNYYALKSSTGWDTLFDFTYTLQHNPADIAEVMNVDQNLWMCVFDNLLVNLDSPINMFHNFYLFCDRDGRINPLLWDLNMSFGGFMSTSVSQSQQLNPLRNSTSNTFLLLKNVLSNPRYKKMYIAHMRTMIEENFINGWYATRGAQLQAICQPHVQADPNYLYSYTHFENNLNNQVSGVFGFPGVVVPGITQLMNGRSTFLLGHGAFAGVVPTLISQEHSQDIQPGDTVQFTAVISDADYVQLGIRQISKGSFAYHEMYDDGLHGDGAAGDGVYGVGVPVSTGDIEYFFWAENSAQGMFFPPRAEYEFFTIPVASTTGEIVINEIMAKNASFPDPFGEADDWVELYNPNSYPVDIAGMYMTDNHYGNGIDAWTQIPHGYPDITTIPPHGYLIVWFDEDMDQGPLHINDKLGGGADSVYLISSDGTTIIDSFTWTAETDLDVNDRSIGRYPDGSTNWRLFGVGQDLPCTPGASNGGEGNMPPVISEIEYSPYPALPGSPVTVSAVISDADADPITAQLLYKDYSETDYSTLTMALSAGRFNAQLPALNDGDQINFRIRASDGVNNDIISPEYNILIGFEAPLLYINELMASNSSTHADEAGEYEDWAEIYNPNDFPVDIAGYYLVDDHYADPNYALTRIPYGFTDQTTIPANGFIVLWFDEDMDQGPLHINDKLGNSADAVYLIAPDKMRVMDSIMWTADTNLATDVSYGRQTDGGEAWRLFGVGQDLPATPGESNTSTATDDPLTPQAIPSLSVYPNPMHSQITIKLDNTRAGGTINIYNLKGQLVHQLEAASIQTWDGKDSRGHTLGRGIYFLSVYQEGSPRLTRKICIVK